jgi:hypothetical protein
MPFDEGRMWKGENAVELKEQLQHTFRNITRVMDCVGCEKCKLWGKLQTLGELLVLENSSTFCSRCFAGNRDAMASLQTQRSCVGTSGDAQEITNAWVSGKGPERSSLGFGVPESCCCTCAAAVALLLLLLLCIF